MGGVGTLIAPPVPQPMGHHFQLSGCPQDPNLPNKSCRGGSRVCRRERFSSAAAFHRVCFGSHWPAPLPPGLWYQGWQGPETGAGRRGNTTQVTRARARRSLSPAAGQPCTLGARPRRTGKVGASVVPSFPVPGSPAPFQFLSFLLKLLRPFAVSPFSLSYLKNVPVCLHHPPLFS